MKKAKPGFGTNRTMPIANGFQITGKSGYTVSVQFGAGTYSSHRDDWDGKHLTDPSALAETAVIGPDGKFVRQPDDNDDVQGWQTPAQVAALIAKYID